MAEEKTAPETPAEAAEGKKPGTMKKILIFGIPVFLIQVVVIYFLTAKFVVPMTVKHPPAGAAAASGERTESHAADKSDDSGEQFIFVVKDMILNPAGTNGQRYLLATIGFNVTTEDGMKSLEKKEMAVRDILNSILTSKSMEELIDVRNRETLRQEIAGKVSTLVDHGKLQSVYFSKYIIQ